MPGWQDILAIIMVAVAVWFVVRYLSRSLRSRGGCHCGHNVSCGAGETPSQEDENRLHRAPFVPVDQLRMDTHPTDSP